MTNTSIRWGLAAVATLLAHATLIALSIICVAVYSYAIHTGETREFYGAFANASAPWVSLTAGGPVFFVIARWVRRRARSAALGTAAVMAGFYLTIDIAVVLLWPADAGTTIPFVLGGFVLKATGAWLGVGGLATRALSRTA